MEKNKLDIINYSKIYDEYGEDAANETLSDVNAGRVSNKLLEKYLYNNETKEEYKERLKKNEDCE